MHIQGIRKISTIYNLRKNILRAKREVLTLTGSNNKFLSKLCTLFLALVLFLVLNGASCFSLGGDTKSKNPEVTLTIWRLFDDKEIFDPIITNYELIRKNKVNIKVNYIKKDYNEYVEDTVNAIAAGKGPDIWMIRNDWIIQQSDKLIPAPDSVVKMDDFKNYFPDVVINDNIIDSKIYGLPYSVDTLALYINTDIFDEELRDLIINQKETEKQLIINRPSNWEEVAKTVGILTKKNGKDIQRAGLALGTISNVDRSTDIITALMLQNQTKMVSDDKQSANFNLPIAKSTGEQYYPAKKALEFYQSFADPNSDHYTWNSSLPNSVDAFIQGKTAMMIHYGYIRSVLKEKAPTLNYEIIPFPQIKDATQVIDYASYWTEVVTNNSKNPGWAWDFIKYINDQKAETYQQATNRPPNKKIDIKLIPTLQDRVKNRMRVFELQPSTAKNWYKGYYPEKVDQVFASLIKGVTEEGQNIDHALDKAASDVTTLLLKKPY